MGVLLIIVFGTLFGGFMLAGMLSLRDFDPDGSLTQPQPAPEPVKEVAPVRRAAPRHRRHAITLSAPGAFITGLERRLRHEFALARAFADDPSVESLWA